MILHAQQYEQSVMKKFIEQVLLEIVESKKEKERLAAIEE